MKSDEFVLNNDGGSMLNNDGLHTVVQIGWRLTRWRSQLIWGRMITQLIWGRMITHQARVTDDK